MRVTADGKCSSSTPLNLLIALLLNILCFSLRDSTNPPGLSLQYYLSLWWYIDREYSLVSCAFRKVCSDTPPSSRLRSTWYREEVGLEFIYVPIFFPGLPCTLLKLHYFIVPLIPCLRSHQNSVEAPLRTLRARYHDSGKVSRPSRGMVAYSFTASYCCLWCWTWLDGGIAWYFLWGYFPRCFCVDTTVLSCEILLGVLPWRS